MNLTMNNQQAYASRTTPHWVVGLRNLLESALRRLLKVSFFTPKFYGGLIQGASARRSLFGIANLFKSATHSLRNERGSSLNLKRAYAMSKHTPRKLTSIELIELETAFSVYAAVENLLTLDHLNKEDLIPVMRLANLKLDDHLEHLRRVKNTPHLHLV
jgi:hypothetical protein